MKTSKARLEMEWFLDYFIGLPVGGCFEVALDGGYDQARLLARGSVWKPVKLALNLIEVEPEELRNLVVAGLRS